MLSGLSSWSMTKRENHCSVVRIKLRPRSCRHSGFLSDLQRRHPPPVVGGGLSAVKTNGRSRNARLPDTQFKVNCEMSQPVVSQVMAQRASAEPRFRMQDSVWARSKEADQETRVQPGSSARLFPEEGEFDSLLGSWCVCFFAGGGRGEVRAGGGAR